MLSYSFYTDVYGGKSVDAGEWERLQKDAAYYIEYVCNVRIPDDLEDYKSERTFRAVADCICALAENEKSVSQTGAAAGISSESTDGYSVSYRDRSAAQLEADKMMLMRKYLANTGLMYPTPAMKILVPVKADEEPEQSADLQTEPKMIFDGRLDMNRIVFSEPVYPPFKISIKISIPIMQNPKITNFEDLYAGFKPNVLLSEFCQIPEGSYQPVFFLPLFYGTASSSLASELGLNGSSDELKEFVNSGNYGLQQWTAFIHYEYPYKFVKTETENLFKPVEPFGRNNTTDSRGRWEEEINFGLWDRDQQKRIYSELSEFGGFGLGYQFRNDLPIYSSDPERMAFLGIDFSNLDLTKRFLNDSMNLGSILRTASFAVYYEKVGS